MLCRYSCDKCNFYTSETGQWNRHIKTKTHIEGKRCTRSDKKAIDSCLFCDYESTSNISMKTHILNMHKMPQDREKEFKFYCKECDYGDFIKNHYEKHLKTKKHERLTSSNKTS